MKDFEPDFFLVSLANGQPNANNKQFNILKRYDYPVMNRFGKQPTGSDFKAFLNSSRGQKNSFERFACFQFLIHLAQKMDIDTAANIARMVAEEQNLEEFMVELLESM